MNVYRADLHIHSVLSPCGDLEMSPRRIVARAVEMGLDIIAVTDHNHTGHARLTRRLGEKHGIWVVYGAEVNTREEVHCLTFFDTDQQLEDFQMQLERYLPMVPNDPHLFGDQVIVDEDEHILSEIRHSLYPGLSLGISDMTGLVHELGGLFVPAHVDRPMNGLYIQLGLFPDGLEVDAVEISRNTDPAGIRKQHSELESYRLLRNSDAHYPEHIGRAYNMMSMKAKTFSEFTLALHGKEGRMVKER